VAIDQLAQHVAVGVVALLAFAVVVRRVLGVFERPPGQSSSPGASHATGPACSHCASGSAAQKRRTG
jgi:hypothetical protein